MIYFIYFQVLFIIIHNLPSYFLQFISVMCTSDNRNQPKFHLLLPLLWTTVHLSKYKHQYPESWNSSLSYSTVCFQFIYWRCNTCCYSRLVATDVLTYLLLSDRLRLAAVLYVDNLKDKDLHVAQMLGSLVYVTYCIAFLATFQRNAVEKRPSPARPHVQLPSSVRCLCSEVLFVIVLLFAGIPKHSTVLYYRSISKLDTKP
jgi:hypothetical protein